MPWIKPAIDYILGGLNKNKDLNAEIACPWHAYCPSFRDEKGNEREKPLPPKLKLIEIPQPMVRLYECQHCGMRFFYGVEGYRISEEQTSHLRNPALIGGAKVF